jgi:alkaline phosphatase
MSTGVATVNGAIGVDRYGRPLEHITQYAEKLGKATGVVTSVPWSHATPAGFMAHDASRGKTESMAQEMLFYSTSEVIMGCGHPLFDNDGQPTTEADYAYTGGESVWGGLVAQAAGFDVDGNGTVDRTVQDIDGDSIPDPWTCIQTAAEFQALMVGPTPKRLLGIPQVHSTLQVERKDRSGGATLQASALPFAIPLIRTVPTLAEMTRAAMNVLDEDPDGFFLMVEGGAADWAAHGHNSGRLIEEQIDFNLAVEAAMQWVEENSSWERTLLIVTADHETGYLTGPGSGPSGADATVEHRPVWNPLLNNGAGALPGMEWHTDGHTCSLVPLFAKGTGSERFSHHITGTDPVRGPYIENTSIGAVMREAFGQKSP